VQALTEKKSDDSKVNFYKELEQVLDHFPKCPMEIVRKYECKIEKIFSNEQLRMGVYIRIVMIMVLE